MPLLLRPTVTRTFLDRVRSTPRAVGFEFKAPGEAKWTQLTYKIFYDQCEIISHGLVELGIAGGDRVAILANTRVEWSLADMAILGARAVTVPIYAAHTGSEVSEILRHSEAKILILEDASQMEKILTAEASGQTFPALTHMVALTPDAMALAARAQHGAGRVMTWSALQELGRRGLKRAPTRFEDTLQAAAPTDLITIAYTSGTTGEPKGAMISHQNMMSVLEDCAQSLGPHLRTEGETVLSFLPFSHILGKVESMAGYVFGWKQVFAEHLDRLVPNLVEKRPTVIFAVPRIFEKALARVEEVLAEGPSAWRKLYEWGLKAPASSGPLAPIVRLARQLVLRPASSRFGGRLKFAICGGAPLPQELGEAFERMGLLILEGYGLTETCAPVTLNTPRARRFGSVGRPLPEVSLKIAEDGEILVHSKKVFLGYYKDAAQTGEVLSDGWLKTGDIGFIDDQGFVHITDRKKDLIITSGGKNIPPQKIENLAKAFPALGQLVVQGDRRHYLTALITLDRSQVERYAAEQHILASGYPELVRHPKIQAWVQKMVDQINSTLASFERIKSFLILPTDFTVESGELTPSLKVRRRFISLKYQQELDRLYSGPGA